MSFGSVGMIVSLRTFHVYIKERACDLKSVVKNRLQDVIGVANMYCFILLKCKKGNEFIKNQY